MADAVWLDVLPSMRNFGPELAKGAGKEADKQGKLFGGKFGSAMLAGVAVVGAGAALAAKALYGVGETFADVENTIRVGTGATGDALDGLVDSAKNIGRNVPAEFEAIGTVVADVNTRLGLTGDTLETFASQALEAGRIMGEEIDINAMSAAFNQFKIEGEDTTDAMDHLFRVSQATGIGMNDLATQAGAAGPAMQILGFSFEETTGMIGAMDKAGLNSSQMMSGMSRSLVNLAKDGEEPAEAFDRVVGEIESFLEAGDQAAAIDLASEVFGTRGAGQFVAALEDGSLAMDDLANVAGMTEDTILEAGEETMTFSEQWQMFKNEIMVEVAPAAEYLFEKITEGMSWIRDHAVPALRNMAEWLGENSSWLIPLAGTIGAIVAAIKVWTIVQGVLNAVMAANPIGIVIVVIAGLVAALVLAWQHSETFRDRVTGAWEYVKDSISTVWDWMKRAFQWIKDGFWEVVDRFRQGGQQIQDAWNAVKDAFGRAWDWIRANVFDRFVSAFHSVRDSFRTATDRVKSAWDSVKDGLKAGYDFIKRWTFDAFVDGVKFVWDRFKSRVDDIKGHWDTLKAAFKAVWDWVSRNVFDKFREGMDKLAGWADTARGALKTAWEKVANVFRRPINWVINTVWNDGIRSVFNRGAEAIGVSTRLPRASTIPAFAEGGRHGGGWALVGEEGPELVNFTDPGRVYTAAQTAEALAAGRDLSPSQSRAAAGSSPTEAVAPMGDNWWSRATSAVSGAVSTVTGWVRGGLASAAEALLSPIRSIVGSTVSQWGGFGGLAGDAANSMMDELVGWIRGKDDEAPPIGGDGWVRPSRGPITSRFGPRWGGLHAGIDVAGGGPVYAAAAGRVNAAGWNILGGRTGIGIGIDHGGGVFTYYGHNPVGGLRVSAGDAVRAGQHIGAQGATGNVTGVHTHFELHDGGWGRAVNPERLGVFDDGGWLKPGHMALNLSNKPEAVFNGSQLSDLAKGARGGATLPDRVTLVDESGALLARARVVAEKVVNADAQSVNAAQGVGF